MNLKMICTLIVVAFIALFFAGFSSILSASKDHAKATAVSKMSARPAIDFVDAYDVGGYIGYTPLTFENGMERIEVSTTKGKYILMFSGNKLTEIKQWDPNSKTLVKANIVKR